MVMDAQIFVSISFWVFFVNFLKYARNFIKSANFFVVVYNVQLDHCKQLTIFTISRNFA